jgi:hypothetical protein
MARPIGRRAFLAKSTMVAAAGTAAAVATTGRAEADAPAKQRGSAEFATVNRHDGELAEVTVRGSAKAELLPLTGFTAGWRLRAGDQVVVATEMGSGTRFVEPLVSFVVGRVDRTPSRAQTIEVAGKTLVLRDATTIQLGDSSADYVVHYITNNRESDVWATSVRPSA